MESSHYLNFNLYLNNLTTTSFEAVSSINRADLVNSIKFSYLAIDSSFDLQNHISIRELSFYNDSRTNDILGVWPNI